MVLTVRHAARILSLAGDAASSDATALLWFEDDEESGAWGGVVEPADDAVRLSLARGQQRFCLQLADGRRGEVEVDLSRFDADGSQPLTVKGIGRMTRATACEGAP